MDSGAASPGIHLLFGTAAPIDVVVVCLVRMVATQLDVRRVGRRYKGGIAPAAQGVQLVLSPLYSTLQFPLHVLFNIGAAFLYKGKVAIPLAVHPVSIAALLTTRCAAGPHARAVGDTVVPEAIY